MSPHGTRNDPYYWLRDDTRKDNDVLAYLEAENAYTKAILAPAKPLEDTLFDELKARVKEDDASVPALDDGYWYYTRFETGKQYPIYARKKGTQQAEEQILLDGNELAKGHSYYAVADYAADALTIWCNSQAPEVIYEAITEALGIERVRVLAASGLSESARLRHVAEAARDLVATPVVLRPEDRQVPPVGYGRNLLHRDAEHQFVVIAMVWPPETGGLPHDHGTWGVVAVSEGSVQVTNFEREDDGSDPARARLRAVETLRASQGAIATVLPPHADFHSVRNTDTDRTAVTIHIYGREPRLFHRVDLATGLLTEVELTYHNA